MSPNNELPKTPTKKAWQKPEIYLLDTSAVNSGGNPGAHERNYDGTIGTLPATKFNPAPRYQLHPAGAPASFNNVKNHKLNFYYS